MMKTYYLADTSTPCWKVFFLAGVLSYTTILCGCAHTPQRLSDDYGQTTSNAFAAQVINPFSPEDNAPVAELPGDLASNLYKNRYLKEMTEKKEENNSGSVANQLD
ncbi:MAG: hypothetical protein CSA20_01935 [Deltaproteobacteria bacterium]|nr:MAG: hypothetical protein CSA20_01935 [Deltaproteobacteria bacterium]